MLLVAAVVLAYQPAWDAEFIWDDAAHITPPGLSSLQGLARIWTEPGVTQQYYPLVYSLFWVEYKLWGYATLGYHSVNILLHAVSALLLWRILRQLEVPGAYWAAAIFALHPVCVESVAWISETKNTLSGAFCLGAALVYLKFDRSRNWKFYCLALGLFLLGLMSKTAIATLPAALLVIFWWQRGKLSWKGDVLPLIPFLVVGIGAGLFTAWMEWKFVGAKGSAFDFTFLERVLIAGRVIWFYLGKVVWPVDLIFIYPRWQVSQTVGWQYFFPAAVLLVSLLLWWLSRWNRGPLAAWLFFVGTLFPALGFFNVYPFRFSFVADHFQYLAMMGPIALAAAGIVRALGVFAGRWWFLKPVLGGALLLTLGVLTWRQCGMYQDLETLWHVTLARNPTCWIAHDNLGLLLQQKGEWNEAAVQFQKGVEINPDFFEAQSDLGYVLLEEGRLPEAIEHFRRALAAQPYPMAESRAEMGLGLALQRQGQPEEAFTHFEAAIKLEPNNVAFLNDLAWFRATCPQARFRNGKEAVQLAERACKLTNDQLPMFVGTLAAAYAEAGRFDDAVATAEKAYGLALALGRQKLAAKDEELLQLFRNRQPYREEVGPSN